MSISGVSEGNNNLPHDFTTLQKHPFSIGEYYAENFKEAFNGNVKKMYEQKSLPTPHELKLVALQQEANQIQLELFRLEQSSNGVETTQIAELKEQFDGARRNIALFKNYINLQYE